MKYNNIPLSAVLAGVNFQCDARMPSGTWMMTPVSIEDDDSDDDEVSHFGGIRRVLKKSERNHQ